MRRPGPKRLGCSGAATIWRGVEDAAYPTIKRALDMVAAAVGLVIGTPLLLLIAALIRIDSPGPVLHWQWRVGRGDRLIRMVKFRTMRAGAEEELEPMLEGDPFARATWRQWQKLYRDPRLTRVGRRLRSTSLDELPQLWNVLRGELSLVGPRPILPSQRSAYGPALESYIQMTPGMTGLWQVSGRNRLSFAERVALDQRYWRVRSLRLDLTILMHTVMVVLRAEGAF